MIPENLTSLYTQLQTAPKDQIQAIKDQIKSLEEQYKIVEKKYKISGRIFDEQTSSPIEGVEIISLLGKIEGENKTDVNGNFYVEVILPTQNDIPLFKSELLYLKDNYAPGMQSMCNLDKIPKSELNSYSLFNIEKAADLAKAQAQIEMDKGIEKASNIFLSGVDKLIVLRRKGINKFIDVIKDRLLPLALQIFILFGIVKIQDIGKKKCPSPELLKSAIRKRNSIVKQLNQIYTAIAINGAIAALMLYISFQLRGLKSTVDGLSIPQAIGTPPGPAGGLIFGMPYSLTGKLQNLSDLLEKFSEDGKKLNKQILIALIFLVVALVIILIYLKKIDGMIEECVKDIDIDISMEEISSELIAIRKENEDEGKTEPITNLNGFTFSIVEDTRQVGSLNRRYAVAKNSQGIILLKGEPSFSSSDQILIDELVFYIKQNNLKAY